MLHHSDQVRQHSLWLLLPILKSACQVLAADLALGYICSLLLDPSFCAADNHAAMASGVVSANPLHAGQHHKDCGGNEECQAGEHTDGAGQR